LVGAFFIKVRQLQSGAIATIAVLLWNRMVIAMAVYCYAATIYAVAAITSRAHFVLESFYKSVVVVGTFLVFIAVKKQR